MNVAAAETVWPESNGQVFAEEARQPAPDAPIPPGDPPKAEGERPPQPPAGHAEPGMKGLPPVEPEPPEWKTKLLKRMETKVSFDFVDCPLADVVAFLRNLTGTNIVLDPDAVKDDPEITLRVTDMRLGTALDWILRFAKLGYVLRDEAIFITTMERLREMMPRVRVYDCRQHLDPKAQKELLNLIVQVTGDHWHPPPAAMRFLDGRLILLNEGNVISSAEALMDEFLRASGATTPRAETPEEPAAVRPTKAVQEIRTQEARELEELRTRRHRRLEVAKALALDPPKDFEQFWAGYSGFMKKGRFDEAGLFCLLTAGVDSVMNAGGEKVATRDLLRQLVKDAERMRTLHKRATDHLKKYVGRMVRIQGIPLKVTRVENGRLFGGQDGWEIAFGPDRFPLEEVLELGLIDEEDPKEKAYQSAIYAFFCFPPDRAKALLAEAAEQGLDTSIYQKLLPKRVEEAAKER
jgi:hypothetical protein